MVNEEMETVNVGKFKVDILSDDHYIGSALRRGHEWDGWMRYDIPHMYNQGTDILDIGGNIGWNALMFSDYGPVHTFEPVFHEIISVNVNQNTLKNPVTVHGYGLSSETTRAEIYLPKKDGNVCNYGGTSLHRHFEENNGSRNIQLKRLDDVYKGHASLMKIDVEGHELEVLKGARETILRTFPSIYVEIFDYTDDCDIAVFLKSLGYSYPLPRPEHNYLFIKKYSS